MINEFDTIAAIATAVSNAGIGIIRISGSEAMEILVKIFEPYNKKADTEVSALFLSLMTGAGGDPPRSEGCRRD